jgi:hypothetical protein
VVKLMKNPSSKVNGGRMSGSFINTLLSWQRLRYLRRTPE